MDDSKQHRIVFNEWRILVMNVYLACKYCQDIVR